MVEPTSTATALHIPSWRGSEEARSKLSLRAAEGGEDLSTSSGSAIAGSGKREATALSWTEVSTLTVVQRNIVRE
jgi:hypothetical protein